LRLKKKLIWLLLIEENTLVSLWCNHLKLQLQHQTQLIQITLKWTKNNGDSFLNTTQNMVKLLMIWWLGYTAWLCKTNKCTQNQLKEVRLLGKKNHLKWHLASMMALVESRSKLIRKTQEKKLKTLKHKNLINLEN